MLRATYEQLVQRIATSTGLDINEINRRVDAKRAKLSDLISKEGAAQIVAAELGISFEKQKVKINELLVGMRKISLTAKVLRIFPAVSAIDVHAGYRCVLPGLSHAQTVRPAVDLLHVPAGI